VFTTKRKQKAIWSKLLYKYGGATGMKALEVNKFRAFEWSIESHSKKAIKLNPGHIDSRWALIELYIKLPALSEEGKSNTILERIVEISQLMVIYQEDILII
jgi:hypothetical protein